MISTEWVRECTQSRWVYANVRDRDATRFGCKAVCRGAEALPTNKAGLKILALAGVSRVLERLIDSVSLAALITIILKTSSERLSHSPTAKHEVPGHVSLYRPYRVTPQVASTASTSTNNERQVKGSAWDCARGRLDQEVPHTLRQLQADFSVLSRPGDPALDDYYLYM